MLEFTQLNQQTHVSWSNQMNFDHRKSLAIAALLQHPMIYLPLSLSKFLRHRPHLDS